MPDGAPGPRQIRTLEEPYGKSALKLKELHQILAANKLWGATFKLAFAAVRAGCPFILEHPAEPQHEGHPSIWRLPIIQMMRQLRCVQLATVAQGYFGAKSPKPTGFLCIHYATHAESILLQHKSQPFLPPPLAAGRKETGEFHTMSLKEYPPALCRALVILLRESLQTIHRVQSSRSDPGTSDDRRSNRDWP